MKRRREEYRFEGGSGFELSAILDLPPDAPWAYALFAHCFTCDKKSIAAHYIGTTLADLGVGVFRFDFTGLGESGGSFADTNFTTNVNDLVAAANFMCKKEIAPQLLIGHSLGGTVSLAAAEQIPEARAVVTINAPYEPVRLMAHFPHQVARIKKEGQALVQMRKDTIVFKKQLLDDLARQTLQPKVKALDKALMVMHAPGDQVVGLDEARRIFDAAEQPKSFVALDQAGHLLIDRHGARYAARVIAAWAAPYLNPHRPVRLIREPRPEEIYRDR